MEPGVNVEQKSFKHVCNVHDIAHRSVQNTDKHSAAVTGQVK